MALYAGQPSIEDYMASTRKSTKRATGKKRGSAKRSSAKKQPSRKAASRSGKRSKALKATTLKRKARKGLRAAKGGIDTVRQAGEKTWAVLKSTTAQVVEGVRDRI
jgi:hypothetical protein